MKNKITEEIRDLLLQIKNWLYLETKYFKLTAAEKITILLGTLIAGAACFMLVMIAVVIVSLCLVGVFQPLVGTVLSYLIVAGIYLLLAVLVVLLRKPLLFNPISKMLTRLFIEHKD